GDLRGRFGAAHMADVLAGAATGRITQLRHDRLAAYAALRGERKAQVRAWIDQLLAHGLLVRTDDEYPTVTLTEQGRAVLRGEGAAPALTSAGAVRPTAADAGDIAAAAWAATVPGAMLDGLESAREGRWPTIPQGRASSPRRRSVRRPDPPSHLRQRHDRPPRRPPGARHAEGRRSRPRGRGRGDLQPLHGALVRFHAVHGRAEVRLGAAASAHGDAEEPLARRRAARGQQ